MFIFFKVIYSWNKDNIHKKNLSYSYENFIAHSLGKGKENLELSS